MTRAQLGSHAQPYTGTTPSPPRNETTMHRLKAGIKADIADQLGKAVEGRAEQPPTSWAPVDLTDALNGKDIPPPSVLSLSDGRCLLYPGRTHSFMGEPESCKTWAALLAASQELAAGRQVLWIDFEDDAHGVVSRLRALGVPAARIKAAFTYLRPDEPLADRYGTVTPALLDLLGALTNKGRPSLCVVDGVTEALAVEGIDLVDNAGIAKWRRLLSRRLTSSGAAAIELDHLTKNGESAGRFAIGAQHKLAGITGAAFRFNVIRPLSRPTGAEPTKGLVRITVTKDRPGHVRGIGADGVVGTLDLDAYPDGGVRGAITPGGAPSNPSMDLCKRILAHLRTYDGATKNGIEDNVEGRREAIRDALRWMIDDERAWVTVTRVGQAHRHHLTDEGFAQL